MTAMTSPFRTASRLRLLGWMTTGAIALVAPAADAQQAPQAAPAAAPAVSPSGANLNITPRRVVLDANRRVATINIINQGTTTESYDITMVDRVMLPDGQIRSAAEAANFPGGSEAAAGLASAADKVIWSPRRVTLAPGRGQTIRLRANLPAGADAAEYRTHLTVTNIPPANVGLTAEQAANAGPDRLSFQVYSVFGVSIPVILRQGTADARSAFADLRLATVDVPQADGGTPQRVPVVQMTIKRVGTSSLFGNIEIRSHGERGGQPLGAARGIGVYPEIGQRALQVALTRAPRPGEVLDVVFIDEDAKPGTVLASSTVTAP